MSFFSSTSSPCFVLSFFRSFFLFAVVNHICVYEREYYEPCIPDLKLAYNLEEVFIIGLLIGTRGTIFTVFENFRKKFGLSKQLSKDVAVAAVKGSCQILHNHLYNV